MPAAEERRNEDRAMGLRLKILTGKQAGKSLPVKGRVFLIGRSNSCQLRIGSDKISRRHCQITLESDDVFVEDFGSRNGTFVNGQRIAAKQLLRDGDRLCVGSLEFEVVGAGSGGDAVLPSSTPAKQSNTEEMSTEDSIAEWLGRPDLSPGSTIVSSASETQPMHVSDTDHGGPSGDESEGKSAQEEQAEEKSKKDAAASKEPGKLPKVPKAPTAKDSTEAAAAILRKMVNRR